jgi:copper resistance protein B
MKRFLAAAILIAAAWVPAAAASQCTPEHAARGHCKMPAVAQPVTPAKPAPVAKPSPKPTPKAQPKPTPQAPPTPPPRPAPVCTPEHAAMRHCKMAPDPTPWPPAAAAPAPVPVDPKCPPEHAAMGHCKPATPPSAPEAPASPPMAAKASGPEHAADAVWGAAAMAPVRRAVYAEHGAFSGSKILLDQFEYRAVDGRDGYAFEGEAWFGGDYDRLWLKTAGEGEFGEPVDMVEAQALFSRAIDPWFNFQAGIRHDFAHGPDRTHLALGIQGLAPYWFEIDAAAFLSTRGEVTARIEAEYDQRITNRLILQPRVEVELAAQDVRELGIGAGLSSIEAGLRLRYEFVPEFAPYFGILYERAIGRTADFARLAGEPAGEPMFVMGVRAWF